MTSGACVSARDKKRKGKRKRGEGVQANWAGGLAGPRGWPSWAAAPFFCSFLFLFSAFYFY
jgi:hypothetical protein